MHAKYRAFYRRGEKMHAKIQGLSIGTYVFCKENCKQSIGTYVFCDEDGKQFIGTYVICKDKYLL